MSTGQDRVESELRRKRRLNSRSDDEIEENIDSRLTIRNGWPTLAPLPLITCHGDDLRDYFPDQSKHITHIRLLLEVQRIEPTFIRIVHRVPYGTTKTDESTATLLVGTKPDVGNMYMAVRDVRKYLAAHDIQVSIELIDERALSMKTYPILPSDTETIREWKTKLRDRLLNYLDHTKMKWVSIDVFHRGLEFSRELCPRTVVISAKDAADDRWWDTILPNIRNLCRPVLEVELVHRGNLIFTPQMDAESAARGLTMEDFGLKIRLGSSCGPVNTLGNGTLGGVIKLGHCDQEPQAFGLSNHHIVRSQTLENVVEARTALSPKHFLVESRSLSIRSPSDRDTNLRLENTEAGLENRKNIVEGTAVSLGLRDKVEMGDDSKRPALEKICRDITRLETERRDFNNSDRNVGHVHAASGYRTSKWIEDYDWVLDWSLTTIDPPRTMENVVDGESARNYIGIEEEPTSWRKASPIGLRVAKLGRSSGWTEGIVNSIETVFSKEDATFNKNVFAWSVAATGLPGYFALSGDSGSIVFDADSSSTTQGCWVGLLFAANLGIGAGYFMPIEMVLHDIRTITGCEILEPTPSLVE